MKKICMMAVAMVAASLVGSNVWAMQILENFCIGQPLDAAWTIGGGSIGQPWMASTTMEIFDSDPMGSSVYPVLAPRCSAFR